MIETGVAAMSTVTGTAVGVPSSFFSSETTSSDLVDEYHNESSRFVDRHSLGHSDDITACIQNDCNFPPSLQPVACNPDRTTATFPEINDMLNLKSDTQHVMSNKSKGNGFAPYESEAMNSEESALPTNLLWNKPTGISVHSGDPSSFSYNIDTFPPLMSVGVTDSSTIADQTIAGTVPGASKRAITGGHNMTKYSTSTRSDTWTPTSLNGSIGLMSSSNWVPNSTEPDKLPTTTFSSGNRTNPSPANPCGANLTWAQMLTQQQSSNKSPFGSSNFGTSAIRSPVHPGTSMVSTSLYSNNTNKCPNGNSLTSIYTMFPKKPQHRMMAHWQQQQHQQQQHPHTTIQHQLARAPGTIPSSSGQLNLNQTVSSSLDVNNMLFGAGAGSGDAGCLSNFNSNCSLLQSPGTMPQHSINQFPIGSSGDTFPSIMSSINTSTDAAPLDSLKFGFDQKMMDVIKSFESTGISQSARTNKDSMLVFGGAGGGGPDDMSSQFSSELDNPFSVVNDVGHLSVLNSHPTSLSTGFGEMNGTNNHAANMRNIPGANLLASTNMTSPYTMYTNIPAREEGYSRKVFVGGLPPDIDEEEITTAFRRFGPLIVDWPHKTESKAYFPPKGYCFLLFQDERSVQSLISACIVDDGKFYWCVSSPTMKDKPVQIRPWNLADSDFVMDGSQPLDPRKTIFVGGVPRPLRAIELALIMDRLYNGVCYAGIDTDPELKYPKGAGRVAFSNQQSYIAAISARFVQLQHNEIDKRVEVKPYVLDNQMCDECQGARCGGKFAPFFCANVTCLQYYCEQCWVHIHSRNGREYHKPLVKEGAERPRPAPYRW